jgi:GNAT superfamily N-acetyltransferase
MSIEMCGLRLISCYTLQPRVSHPEDWFMEIVPFQVSYLPEAAALFAGDFRRLRAQVGALPDGMADAAQVAIRLEALADRSWAAVERGELVGYLGAFVIDHFRDTARKGAYCPEWGHAAAEAAPTQTRAVYRALYRAAASQWAALGCDVHAITLLAHDRIAETVWFWQGFGMVVVDAIRPITPLMGNTVLNGLAIRQATPDDADRLAALDAAHCAHYTRSPIFMAPREVRDAAEFRAFLREPDNSVWLALDGGDAVGFMQFEGHSDGAADIVSADSTIAITGAYIDPLYRGRGAGKALLDAALREYAGRGFTRCAVDFESFNPEAAVFWMKYFTPVCLSVMRVPETAGA